MCKTKKELNKLVAKYRELSAEQKKINKQLKDIKGEIIDYVLAKGVRGGKDNLTLIVFGDDYKVSYITVISHNLDTDRVRAFLGDNVAEFQVESISNKLDIR